MKIRERIISFGGRRRYPVGYRMSFNKADVSQLKSAEPGLLVDLMLEPPKPTRKSRGIYFINFSSAVHGDMELFERIKKVFGK